MVAMIEELLNGDRYLTDDDVMFLAENLETVYKILGEEE